MTDRMKNTAITGIIPFSYFLDMYKQSGSTFLRADRLAANDAGFEMWKHGKKYDNLIFQKAYWPEMMKLFDGPKILDVCDPDWFQESLDMVDIGHSVHAITCSSEGLTRLVQTYFPKKIVVHVPDRLDMSIFPEPHDKHQGGAKTAVWFGFIHNAHETLGQLLPALKRHNLKLKIISNQPYSQEDGVLELKPEFVPYRQDTAYSHIKEGDLVLNPRSERAFYKYKSNNKTIIAWKLGLPVAATNEDVDRFIDQEERNKEVEEKKLIVKQNYNIKQSALQYREIIAEIRNRYF
jgi:hypothetical protein